MIIRTTILKVLILSIRVYQTLVSPIFGPTCRFHPSCSNYAIEAIRRHGIFKGAYLSGKRVLKCHPFHPGGIDLVP